MLNKNYFDYFIIGVNSKENLIKILNADYNKKEKYKKIKYDLFKNTKSLIKPYNW